MDKHQFPAEPPDEVLREIFALIQSPTAHEREEVYDTSSRHFHERVQLDEEVSITLDRRSFALDAWRAALTVLHVRNFQLANSEGALIPLGFIDASYS